jgi:hypothetical protein
MSSKHEDYVREQRKGEIYGGNAIDTSTAGGRAAHYEHLGKQSPGGGFWLVLILFAGPFIVNLTIPAALSAWVLKFVVPVPEGMPPLTYLQRFKAGFFATLPAAGVLALPVARGLYGMHLWSNYSQLAPLIGVSVAVSIVLIVLQMLAGGLALKLSLPTSFRGFRGYLWASLTSLLVGVVALIWVAWLLTMVRSSGQVH